MSKNNSTTKTKRITSSYNGSIISCTTLLGGATASTIITISLLLATTEAFTPSAFRTSTTQFLSKHTPKTFTSKSTTTAKSTSTSTQYIRPLASSMFDDFEDFDLSNNNEKNGNGLSSSESSDEDMWASLRARQNYLTNYGTSSSSSNDTNLSSTSSSTSSSSTTTTQDYNSLLPRPKTQSELTSRSNWKNAKCTSTVRLTLNDWIRRIAIHTYPLAVCGSANGSIYLADLESGDEMDCVRHAHLAQISGLLLDDSGMDDDDNDGDYRMDLDPDEDPDALLSSSSSNNSNNSVEEETKVAAHAMNRLYGAYDGGGVISIAIHKEIVVSSGREGGVRIFQIDGTEESYYKGSRGGTSSATKLKLVPRGMMLGGNLDRTLVTSMAFDEAGTLWIGGFDGVIRGYEYDDCNAPLWEQKEPLFEMDTGSEILSLSVNDKVGCGVVATSSGKVILFSLEDGEIMASWKPFGKKRSSSSSGSLLTSLNRRSTVNANGGRKREYARSAIIVQNDEAAYIANKNNGDDDDNNNNKAPQEQQGAVWSVICGGSEGTMYQRRLNVDRMGYVSYEKSFLNDESITGRLRPTHSGPVVALSSPSDGLLLSGSQDGHVRVWDCSYYKNDRSLHDEDENEFISIEQDIADGEAYYDDISGTKVDRRPDCLYALTGYKVWFGSMFTNMQKLVSDGADNTLVVHDFSGKDDGSDGFLFEGEEDDDLEGFSFD